MKKLFYACFAAAWKPVIFFIAGIVVAMEGDHFQHSIISKIAYYFCYAGIAGMLISFVYRLITKQWLQAFLTAGVFFAVFTLTAIFTFMDSSDHFADDLSIPANIRLSTLLPTELRDSVRLATKDSAGLHLFSDSPGEFDFDVRMGKTDSGIIYLRAFEIKHGEELSADRLANASQCYVNNHADTLTTCSSSRPVVIYEGDFGKPYAARIEVWFKNSDGTNDKKLLSENYIIEGWQR